MKRNIIVHVNQYHVDEAYRVYDSGARLVSQCCPLATALNDQFPQYAPWGVGMTSASPSGGGISSNVWEIDEAGQRVIDLFNRHERQISPATVVLSREED